MANENTIGQQLKLISNKIVDNYEENKDLILELYNKSNLKTNDHYNENENLIQLSNTNNKIDTTYSDKQPKNQAQTLGELLSKNKFTPEKPFKSDFISAQKQQFQQAIDRQKESPGKVNEFLIEQQVLAAFDKGINVVNPLILTNAITPEGILTTKVGFSQIGYDKLTDSIDSGEVTKPKRIAASKQDLILGQEEGIPFSSIRTIGDLISKGTDALVGLFSSEKKKNVVPLKATEATFEQRLAQNDLTPDNRNSEIEVYNAVYNRKYIGSISQKIISEGFSPIGNESENPQLLKDDTTLVLGLEDAINNNAIKDNTYNNLNHDGEAYNADIDVQIFSSEAPKLQGTNVIFPFYMESLNTLQEDEERFITFQATFNGIKEGYKPNWTPLEFFGRNTNAQLYSNTERNLNFDFVIWAKNRFDLAVVKKRVNWLVKHTYPKYKSLDDSDFIKIISEAPVISITIGDNFKDVSGVITNLDLDWDMEGNNRWELSDGVIMYQMVKVNMSFNVIYNKFMENVDRQNFKEDNKLVLNGDFYPAININKLRKRKFNALGIDTGGGSELFNNINTGNFG